MSGRHLLATLGSSSWVELARLVPTGPLPAGAYSRTGAVVVGATIWTSLLVYWSQERARITRNTYDPEYVRISTPSGRGYPSKQF